LKRCPSAFLYEVIGVEAGCFDISTAAINPECSVNTSRYFVGIE
jgi:hypothetical protein